jgi:hypothetical protein
MITFSIDSGGKEAKNYTSGKRLAQKSNVEYGPRTQTTTQINAATADDPAAAAGNQAAATFTT